LHQELSARLSACELSWFSEETARQDRVIHDLVCLLEDCSESGRYAGIMSLDPERAGLIATRCASLLSNMVMTASFRLTETLLITLASARWVIKDVFRVSGYRGTLHLRVLLNHRATEASREDEADSEDLPEPVALSLLFSCLDDVLPEHVDALFRHRGVRAAVTALSLLSDRNALTPYGERIRERLLGAAEIYDELPLYQGLRHLAAIAWMHCSYASATDKHLIKKPLNAWFKRLAAHNGLVASAPARPRSPSQKPTLMVVSEMFRSGHAMFRWYAPLIRALREHFTLHLLSLPDEVDADSLALFDRFLPVGNFQAVKAALRLYAPDMVYFPSIGMRSWSIMLANVRWAPVQLMTLGHPATTHSACIDGVILPRAVYRDAGVFSETILLQAEPGGNHIEPHRGLDTTVALASDWHDSVFVMAVPCISLKLNGEFLETLDAIRAQVRRPMRFAFFPNETGLALQATRWALQRRFPGCDVHPRLGYVDYLRRLSTAHVALSPFPFGNSSSLVDVMLLGLPVVALRGREPHALTDFSTLSAAGLAHWCHGDRASYVEAAVRLCDDASTYAHHKAQLREDRLERVHTDKGEKPAIEEMVKTFLWALSRGERLRPGGAVVDGLAGWSVP